MRGRRRPAGGGRGKIVPRVAACLGVLAGAVGAQDIGHSGPSFAGASPEPTESKTESKLWYHGGSWWGVLWSSAADAFHLQRFDQQTHAWTDTGLLVDARTNGKADVLCDGETLYVGTHRFDSHNGTSGNPILLLRFHHDETSGDYTLDPGFPVTIDDYSTESLNLARDSAGVLWAAWMRSRRIYVAHGAAGDDSTWVTSYVLPASDVDLDSDEVCAAIHFGGDRIGVMWSDQRLDRFRFAIHQDGEPDGVWSVETPLAGEADDHVNLATDSAGRVFAAVKNADDELKLLVRDGGTWTQHLVATGVERLTRPLVLLDEEARLIHVFATGQDDGHVHHKTSSLDAIGFAPGTGDLVMRDASDPLVNNPTSTKQNVDSSTGLVVLAAHETSEEYWHHSVAPAALLVADFGVDATFGSAPLAVQFTDRSTGAPTDWAWSFGDGGTSAEQHPLHVFAAPGTYAVTLTVANAGDLDSETRAALVTVEEALPTQIFAPVADARIEQDNSGTNYGAASELRLRLDPGRSLESLLRFDLAALAGPVATARLRLFCLDGSVAGGEVFPTTGAWGEDTVTWSTCPGPSGPLVTSNGSNTPGTWVTFDVTDAVAAPGQLDLLLRSSSPNLAAYASRESATPPELVVRVASLVPPLADFTATPTSGEAPLAVAFTDLSTGVATSWSWDFGDGSGSTERHPVHVYAAAGTYTVALVAANSLGSSSLELTDLVTVTPPAPPSADFGAAPTTGAAPLPVAFADLSTGAVTGWLWDFGDGASSTEAAPLHVYAAPGTYTVGLSVVGPGGSDAVTKTDLVVVAPPPPVQSLVAVADARVSEASPGSNAGAATELRVRLEPAGSYESYVRFDVPVLAGPVVSARLRLFCTDGSPEGGIVAPTSSAWDEGTLTWANRPPASGPALGALGAVSAGAWHELDVTAAVTGTGPVSFVLASSSSNSALHSSREGTSPPELVIETGAPPKPPAPPPHGRAQPPRLAPSRP